jgi:preprotein translocase subunit YajC
MFALIWMILMLAVFYVLLVRPQRRQMMVHRALMSSLESGDEVVTMGGIFGRIVRLDDEVVDLEVAPGTSLRVARSAISRRI